MKIPDIRKGAALAFAALFIASAGILAAAPAGIAARRTDPQVSLITILPGKALYSSFGHTAIRVVDPGSGSDVLYSYGLSENPFDLLFAARMLVGRMDFTVGVLDTASELQFYRQVENRTIVEQRLDLGEREEASMLSTLEKNALPENRIYNYRYFSDNCATRVWKIIETESAASGEASGASLRPSRPTLRRSLGRTLASRPWLSFAIDLMLGPEADARLRPEAPIFLPVELMEWTAGRAKAETGGGEKLVGSTKTLYLTRPEKKGGPGVTPLAAAIALSVLALALGLFLRKSHPVSICLDAMLFGATSIVCLAIALFWLAAGYGEVGWNLNLLWANPLALIALLYGRKRSGPRTSLILFRIAAAAAALLAVLGGLGLQTISPEERLIALALAISCLARGLGEGRIPPSHHGRESRPSASMPPT
jgi:hypothetical protein